MGLSELLKPDPISTKSCIAVIGLALPRTFFDSCEEGDLVRRETQ